MIVLDHGRTRRAAISLGTVSMLAMVFFLACMALPARVFDVVVSASHASTQPGDANEAAFLSENDAAMTRMMARRDDDSAPPGRHRHGEGVASSRRQ